MDQFATIVLLIDPDARHRATAAQLLKSSGCSVVAVRNASEAIETFDAHHTDIALIIADDELVRPEAMRDAAAAEPVAPELLPEIKRIDARVPIVVMTGAGAAEPQHDDRYRAIAVAGVLTKPLEANEVSALLSLTSPVSSATLAAAITIQTPGQAPVAAPVAVSASASASISASASASAPAPAPLPLVAAARARAIEDTIAPWAARHRSVRVTRSQRFIATAVATVVGLTLTTWLEVRGGASPQLPEPVPAPSVDMPAPQTHVLQQAISPIPPPSKRTRTVRRPGTAARVRAPALPRRSNKAAGVRRAETSTGATGIRRVAFRETSSPQVSRHEPADPERPAVSRPALAPQPARVKRVFAFIGRTPRLCAKPFTALWRKLRDTRGSNGTGGGDVERDERGPSADTADIL